MQTTYDRKPSWFPFGVHAMNQFQHDWSPTCVINKLTQIFKVSVCLDHSQILIMNHSRSVSCPSISTESPLLSVTWNEDIHFRQKMMRFSGECRNERIKSILHHHHLDGDISFALGLATVILLSNGRVGIRREMKVKWATKKNLGWLGYIGDQKLPSYIGDYNEPL